MNVAMNLKNALTYALSRKGRLLLSYNVLFPLFPNTLLFSPSCKFGIRSVSAWSAGLTRLTTRNGLNDSLTGPALDLRCRNSSRTCQQHLLRTVTTQVNPATEASEVENKQKGNVNKTQVTYEELLPLVASGSVKLVDVREPDELEKTGSLPGCINIPLTKLKVALALSDDEFTATYNSSKLQKEDLHVIFYGLSSVKSSAAVEIAHKMGFKKSRHFAGGLEEWYQKHQKC